MPHIKTRGIVLRRSNMGEADRLITVYTEKLGKIKVKAKGVRKPLSKLAGHLEPLTESMLGLAEGKTFYTLTDATTLSIFPNLRQELKRTSSAFYVADLIDQLTEEAHRQEQIYHLLRETLELLDSSHDEFVLPAFMWRLLAASGYKPELHFCVEGREKLSPDDIYFSFTSGGLVCKAHAGAEAEVMQLDPDTVKLLRITLTNIELIKRIKLTKAVTHEYSEVVNRYGSRVMERKPKSAKFLDEVNRSYEQDMV